MTVYIPYGLIAVGISIYAGYRYRRKRENVLWQRQSQLNEVRQQWLDLQLRKRHSDIILYGDFMEQKIAALNEIGGNKDLWETYYADENNQEKWIKEYPHSAMHGGGPVQLRKVQQFPFE